MPIDRRHAMFRPLAYLPSLAVLAALAALAACASTTTDPGAPGAGTSASADSGSTSSADEVTVLRVDNDSLATVQVYVVQGVVAYKVDALGSNSRRIVTIPKHMVGSGEAELVAYSVHAKELHRTGMIPLEPGHLYIYTLRPSFGASSVEWYPFDKVPESKKL